MIFHVTDQQADQIMNALAARPFMEVAPIIQELVQQIQQQKQANPQNAPRPFEAALQGGALNGAGAAEQRSQ